MSIKPNHDYTGQGMAHESALKHVTGAAYYIDDQREPEGMVHIAVGLSTRAHAKLCALDVRAVRASSDVVMVITAADLKGVNNISPVGLKDDPVFAEGVVQFHGQPLFAVAAISRDAARRAVQKAHVVYEDLPFVLDIEQAIANNSPNVTAPLTLKRGDAEEVLQGAKRKLKGQMKVGGQDHFYLESHIAVAIPGEDHDMTVLSSTQHPTEVQHMVAHVLNIPNHAVTVDVRRIGGGFGGKETQSNFFAVVAAFVAKKLNRPAKFRPDRDEDMIATGKRHDFMIDYEVAFDDDGVIEAVRSDYRARCGFSADLSGPVTDRALFHADNAYYSPHVLLQSHPLKTNTVSNTAFRGFGGPQGMLGGERIIEEIAYALKLDPLEVRRRNFYGGEGRNITPYHQTVTDFILPRLIDELVETSNYHERRRQIIDDNQRHKFIRKGIALTPIKFGISFTATWYNQAGALVHIYRDGSLQINHGGIEMGQGLHTKLVQVAADTFALNLDQVKITASRTDKVPNTSATAASSGTDLNGMAVLNACHQIKARLVAFAAQHFGVAESAVVFHKTGVVAGEHELTFGALIELAYMNRVHMSAAGFYKTPDIYWDRATGKGRPFNYFAYGAAVSEVSVDSLTGEYRVDRVDILHDVGQSLNSALDKGQIEGGFVQGLGWLTTEELWWDQQGKLRTHAPSTYKIPLASDIPREFNVELAHWSENVSSSLRKSKAVGEPPLMLAMSVVEALGMAVASHADYHYAPNLETPVTPERVLMRIEALKAMTKEGQTL